VSSKPSPAGVEQLIDKLDFLSSLEREIAELRPKAARLKECEGLYASAHREVTKQLDAMDVSSNGNAGWEGRVTWMLLELIRQARSHE
jgi:hypothetical protein